MSMNPDLRIFANVALDNRYTFANSALHDALLYPESNSQKILIGVSSNTLPAITIASNFVQFASPTSYFSNTSIGIGISNPTEKLDVRGNTKVSSNLYVMNSLSIGPNSNTTPYSMTVGGAVALSNNGGLSILSTSNSYLGIGSSSFDPTETLTINGNSKISSNAFVLNFVGVRTSNVQYPLTITPASGGGAISLSNVGISANNSNIGIGILLPTHTLTVGGSIGFGNSSSGYIATSNNYIGINTSAPSESVTISNNVLVRSNLYAMANIQIGTSNVSTTSALTIAGGIALIGSGGQSQYIATSNSYIGIGTTSPIYPLTITGGGLALIGTDASTQYIASSNSYIGIGTSNPTAAFVVAAGNVRVQSNAYVLNNVGIGTSNPQFSVDITGDVNFTGILRNVGVPVTVSSYWKSNNAAASSIYMLTSNIGIGISNPASLYSLDVAGSININKVLSNNNKLFVMYDSASSDSLSNALNFHGFGINSNVLRYQVPALCSNLYYVNNIAYASIDTGGVNLMNGNGIYLGAVGSSNSIQSVGELIVWPNTSGSNTYSESVYGVGSNNSTAGDHVWFTGGDATTGIERFRIASDGTVNLGGSLTCANIIVTGTTYMSGRIGVGTSTPSTGLVVNNSSTYSIMLNSWMSAGDYYDTSDARMKTNIEYIQNGMLEKVCQLKPCEFNYNYSNPLAHKTMGFIAQDLESVLPMCITRTSNVIDGESVDNFLTLNYQQLVAVALAALQDLKAESDELEANLKLIIS